MYRKGAKKTIVFVGNNHLTNHFANDLAIDHQVHTISNTNWSSTGKKVSHRKLSIGFFGFLFLNNTLLKNRELALPVYYRKLNEVLNSLAPEILIVQEFTTLRFFQCLWYRLRNRQCKLFVISETKHTPHSSVSRVPFWFFIRVGISFQRYIDHVLVFSDRGQKWFKAQGLVKPVTIIRIPVNEEIFYAVKNDSLQSDIRIIINARIVPFKQHHLALDVLESLASTYQYSLTLLGQHKDLVLYKNLKERIDRGPLKERTKWIEQVPFEDVAAQYHKHDVLLLPSRNEALGLVVPEAMACGLATITSDSVGANSYVDPGKTGLVFATHDSHELKKALEYYLVNPDIVSQHKYAATQRMKTEYSRKKLLINFREILSL